MAEAAHKIWIVCLASSKTLGGADESLKRIPQLVPQLVRDKCRSLKTGNRGNH